MTFLKMENLPVTESHEVRRVLFGKSSLMTLCVGTLRPQTVFRVSQTDAEKELKLRQQKTFL